MHGPSGVDCLYVAPLGSLLNSVSSIVESLRSRTPALLMPGRMNSVTYRTAIQRWRLQLVRGKGGKQLWEAGKGLRTKVSVPRCLVCREAAGGVVDEKVLQQINPLTTDVAEMGLRDGRGGGGCSCDGRRGVVTAGLWAARSVLLSRDEDGRRGKGYLDVAVFLVWQPVECGQRQVIKPRPDALVWRSNEVDDQLQLMQLKGKRGVKARSQCLNPRRPPFREVHMRHYHLAHL